MAGALGSVGLAAATLWPGVMTHGPVVWVTDGALLVTGIGLIARQPDRWTGPLCLGFMTSKAVILTLAIVTVGVTARVPWVLTLLIFFYMTAVLAAARAWLLAVGAMAAGFLAWLGLTPWAQDVGALWFLGMAGWIAPAWLWWSSRHGRPGHVRNRLF